MNPYLSKEGLAALIKTLEKFPELFKAKIMGLFVALEGLVYPMFRENVHVIDDFEIRKAWHKVVVADIHLNKPAAIGWYAWSPGGVCYKYREMEWEPNVGGIPDLAKKIRILSGGEHIEDWIMDESMGGAPDQEKINVFGEKTVITQLNDCKLPFIGTNQAGGKAVEAGILKLREFLRPNPSSGLCRFYVFASCPLTIKQYMTYQFKKKTLIDEESYRERLRNIDDDHVTDDRYAIASEPAWNMPKKTAALEYDGETGTPIDDYQQQQMPTDQVDSPWSD